MIYIKSDTIGDVVNIDDTLDVIILSPSLYWFEILELPTKSISKATKLANHILSNRPSSYIDISILKKDDKFEVYAYNKKQIEKIVISLNKKSAKIYFASELPILDTVLVSKDSTIELIPYESTIIEYDNSKSNKNISTLSEVLQTNKNFKKLKPLFSISNNSTKSTIFMILINLCLFLSISIYTFQQYTNIQKIKSDINSIDTEDRSSYEIKALIKKYTKYEDNNIKLKKDLFQTIENNNKFQTIRYQDGKINVK